MTSLNNRTALVTGSARGIGRAIAERYAALGANVVVNYSTGEAQARDTVAAIEQAGGTVLAVQANVARAADVDRLCDATLERFGSLDIVVVNAGVELIAQPLLDVSEEDFDRLYSINAKGSFLTLQRAARHVADNGRIIYIGSSSTACPQPGMGPYSSSKIAGQLLVEVLSKEIGARGVTVNSILPTATEGAGIFAGGVPEDVAQFIQSVRPIRRMGTVDDVADAADAAEYLAGSLAGFVSGQHLLISGGAPA
jgi:3-oxoacyl-[acyl-carrier protein] reductase